VEANGKQNKDPESTRGTTMEMEEEGERVIAQVNTIKLLYLNIWKFHDETPYYVEFNIHQ
jgi:hypothetical protein